MGAGAGCSGVPAESQHWGVCHTAGTNPSINGTGQGRPHLFFPFHPNSSEGRWSRGQRQPSCLLQALSLLWARGEASKWVRDYIFIYFFILSFFFFFWPCRTACGILFPQPGIEPMCPVVEARSLNHWATREVLYFLIRWKMRLCLKVPGRAKGSAKTFFGLGAGRLDGEGLMGRGVNTQLRCSHWKPRAKLPHSWA